VHRFCPVALALILVILAGGTSSADPAPYAGMESRPIKALSEEEVADLLAGRGAGMALPAELNHYPGPVHVLELGAELRLSPAQETETRRLFERMRSEAVPLGEAIVAKELQLDGLFASETADEHRLPALVHEIARLRGELRFTHLKYHLAMRRLLSPEQVATYEASRGYASGHGGHNREGPAGGPTHR
jgi:Spy/CpxP family protein refolding chaperone